MKIWLIDNGIYEMAVVRGNTQLRKLQELNFFIIIIIFLAK